MRVVHLFFEYPHPYQPYNVKLIQTQRDAGIDAVPVALSEARWYSRINCKWLELLLVRLDMLLYFIGGGLKWALEAKKKGNFGWKDALSLSYKNRNILHLRPDVIHVHHYAIANSGFRNFFRALKIPWCLSIRGRDVMVYPLTNQNSFIHIKSVLNEADAIHSVSCSLRQRAIELGCNPERVSVIHRSAESRIQFMKENYSVVGTFSILYIGRFSWEKGVTVLLKAVKRLKDEGICFHLNLCGSGDPAQIEEVSYLIHCFNIADSVTLHGKIDDHELEKILPHIDIYVQPSVYEGVPNTLIKLTPTGIPVVATRTGGIPEIIKDGFNGILVPPCDSITLAEKIKLLLNNERLRVQLGRNLAKTSWQCSLEEGKQYYSFYQQVGGQQQGIN